VHEKNVEPKIKHEKSIDLEKEEVKEEVS